MSKEEELIDAVKKGDLSEVQKRIKSSVDVNIGDRDGSTPLIWAAFKGHIDIVKVLIEAGANVNAKDQSGRTALIWVAQCEGTKTVQVQSGIALMRATRCVGTKTVQVLLEAGADVDVKDEDGWTALMWAADRGYTNIVEALIKAGADVNAKDNDGYTALMKAAWCGYTNVVEALIKAGADVNARSNVGYTAFSFAKDRRCPEIVAMLEQAASWSRFMNDAAIWMKVERAVEKALQQTNSSIKVNKIALGMIQAAKGGDLQAVQNFLNAGADVNAKNMWGKTALDYTKEMKYSKIVAMLEHATSRNSKNNAIELKIEGNANVSQQTNSPETNTMDKDLVNAIISGDLQAIQKLLCAGVNVKDKYKRTPLMWAIYAGQIDIANALIKAGADVNAKDVFERTPLMWAAYTERLDIADALIKAGADVNAKDINGNTALDYAEEMRYPKIVIMLEQAASRSGFTNNAVAWMKTEKITSLENKVVRKITEDFTHVR